MRPMVGRATYLGPYNVPRTSRPAEWRLMPAVAYLLLASHPVEQELGRTDLPSAGWPSAGGPSLLERRPRRRGRPDSCCSCSTAPVGLRESVGRRLPRRAHQPYSHGQDHPCKNLPACQQQPCAPPGRASSRAGWGGSRLYGPRTAPAVWGRSTADSGLQSVQTGGQAADPRQTGRQRGAGLQSVPAYTDITMDSVQCLTSPHENPFHFRLHFCILGKLCQSWVQSGSHCGQ